MIRIHKSLIIAMVAIFLGCGHAYALEQTLEQYISRFDNRERSDMKINSAALLQGVREGGVQLIDIRFKEEYEAWKLGIGTSIPLNELPDRIEELDRTKIIVTACPQRDRAILAMVYLRTKGFRSKYLFDGLIRLAEYMRGNTGRPWAR